MSLSIITDLDEIKQQIPDTVARLGSDQSHEFDNVMRANYGSKCHPLTYNLLSELKQLSTPVPAITYMIRLNKSSKISRIRDIHTITFHSERECDSDDPDFAKHCCNILFNEEGATVPGYFSNTTPESKFEWGDGDAIYIFVVRKWNLPVLQPKLASNVEWLGPDLMPVNTKSGKWFYNTRDKNKMEEIVRVFDLKLLDKIKNDENPFTRKKWDPQNLATFDVRSGGNEKQYYLYKNRRYLVRLGPRGGKYILVHDNKISIK